MARTPLLARMSLDEIRCNEEGDGFGSAEPYLWTVFFKIDGDSVIVGDDTFLQGECTIMASDGSHGNLGDRDVDAGDTLVVPRSIGEFRTTLRPIPLSEKLQEDHPDEDARCGALGVVFVLLEEDQVTDAGARAGYAALVDYLRKQINDIIPTLYLGKQDITDEEIDALIDKAFDTIEDAIRSVQSAGENFWSWVDADDTIGYKLLRFSHDDLADNYWDINERFQKVAQNGVVVEDWRVTGETQGARQDPHNYTHARRSEDVGSPPAASAPTTCLHPASGVQNIVYRDTRGHLHELWRDAIGQIGTTDLTTKAGAPTAAGDPFAYLETTTDLELVVYRDSGPGGVHSLYWSTGDVGLDNLSLVAGSPAAAGTPVGHFNPATGTHHIVYRGQDGHLHVVYWTGADDPAHYEGPLTATDGVARAAGDPSAYFNSAENVVVYRAPGNHVHDVYWSTGEAGHEDLSGVARPSAVGEPVAYYIPSADLQQVTYRIGGGHLYEMYWRGGDPPTGWDLMERSGAPEAVSDPAVFYSAATNTKHAVYRGPFGHLFELSWVHGGPPPTVVDLTLAARAPRAVDRPAAFTFDAANTRYVVYRGFDNQIHEISWTARPGASPGQQSNWRWCNKCQGLFYGGNTATSRCPAGGTHTPSDQSGSFDYILPHGAPLTPSSQPDWRWCSKCQGLFYGGNTAQSRCPTGGTHTPAAQSGSADYILPHTVPIASASQGNWRWCNRCQGLFYGGNVASSRCPTGGAHTPPNQSGSADYILPESGPIL